MNFHNYLELPTRQPLRYKYLYVDIDEEYAKKLFKYEGIKADCLTVASEENTPYIMVDCTIPKRDEEKFKSTMEHLAKKMKFEERYDYPQACRRLFGQDECPDRG